MLLPILITRDVYNDKKKLMIHKGETELSLLLNQNRYVTLEDAANVLIGDEEEGQTKYKSKIIYTAKSVSTL